MKLIKEKEKEKENESKIYAQISEYLQTQKHKIGQDKEEWMSKKAERDLVNKDLNKKLEGNIRSKTDKIKHLNENIENYNKKLDDIKHEDNVYLA
jgi:hypothetical protein